MKVANRYLKLQRKSCNVFIATATLLKTWKLFESNMTKNTFVLKASLEACENNIARTVKGYGVFVWKKQFCLDGKHVFVSTTCTTCTVGWLILCLKNVNISLLWITCFKASLDRDIFYKNTEHTEPAEHIQRTVERY